MTHAPDPSEAAIIAGLAAEPNNFEVAYALLKLARSHDKIAQSIESLAAALSDLAESK